MNRQEHLLTILGEECNEVAHRISKALRFGLQEIQRDQKLTNRERIEGEIADLFAVIELLVNEKILNLNKGEMGLLKDLKKEKIIRYMNYSKSIGTLAIENTPEQILTNFKEFFNNIEFNEYHLTKGDIDDFLKK